MQKSCLALLMFIYSFTSHAATISYKLCNKHGVSDVSIIAKDKKNGMAVVYEGKVTKDDCALATSSTGSGEYAEIEMKVGQGTPYGVPWIKAGDSVNF